MQERVHCLPVQETPHHAEIRLNDVQRRFDRAANGFDSADFAHAHVRGGLLERLEPMEVSPGLMLDLGSATGSAAFELARRYRKSRVVAIDASEGMARRVSAKRRLFSKVHAVQADAKALPIPDHSAALVFSNLLLPWIEDPDTVFGEVARVLKKDAPFIFSALGPDSLKTVADAFDSAGADPRINVFPDMHDIGDGLVRAGLRDPVLDVDRLTIDYSSAQSLFDDLAATGARNALAARRRTLLGRRQFETVLKRLGSAFTVELEIVYGHAWGSGQSRDDVRIDAGRIPVRRR
ncbi:MAG: class I SAM-dependent methyltransferase [Woeseiaceae bacterium]|nr:class I SAM-dependent methyltransferase [Woeseiaceae bacterium]